jgi:hypothetical protein
VAEGGGLLNRYTPERRIEGSNPSVSATGMAESTPNQFQKCQAATVSERGSPGGLSRRGQFRDERGKRQPKSSGAKVGLQVAPGNISISV